MITTAYRVEFPPDVVVIDSSLCDGALNQSYPLNDTANLYLDMLRAGEPMPDIVDAVSTHFAIPQSDVERDLLGLVARLNAVRLVNVYPRSLMDKLQRILFVTGYISTTGNFPPILVKRRYIANEGPMHIVLSVARALCEHALPALVASTLVITVLAILAFEDLAHLLAGVLVGILLALVLHEAGHAVAVGMAGGRSYLIMTGLKVAVVHTRGSSPAVHAAGPLAACVAGLVVLLAALIANSTPLALMSCPLITQIASLTAFAEDGRSLVHSFTAAQTRRMRQ